MADTGERAHSLHSYVPCCLDIAHLQGLLKRRQNIQRHKFPPALSGYINEMLLITGQQNLFLIFTWLLQMNAVSQDNSRVMTTGWLYLDRGFLFSHSSSGTKAEYRLKKLGYQFYHHCPWSDTNRVLNSISFFWWHLGTLHCQVSQMHPSWLHQTTYCLGCSCYVSWPITRFIKLKNACGDLLWAKPQILIFFLHLGPKRIGSRCCLTGEVLLVM